MAPKDDATFRAADHAMHELWTWAVGLPGYDKKKWQALERAIGELARERMAEASPPPDAMDVDVWHGRIISMAAHLTQMKHMAPSPAADRLGLRALDDLITLCRRTPQGKGKP